MSGILRVDYRGADIRVEAEPESARLFINGIQREAVAGNGEVRLQSSVKTDYEWHEWVEAIINRQDGNLSIALYSNNTLVAQESFTDPT